MDSYDDSMAPRFRELLRQREQQLRAVLRPPVGTGAASGREVVDFKDIATEESLAAVDAVQAEHASRDLQLVLAALSRLDGDDYGRCQQCGEAIDLQRLAALPATPLCFACQTLHEHGRRPGAPR